MSPSFDSTSGVDYPNSMLSRKFGKEIVNYFSGSPLNRVSFLRSNNAFLRAALPHSKFLLLKDLEPLASSPQHLAFLTYPDVRGLIGNPYELDEEKYITAYDSRVEVPQLLFLGLDEKKNDVGFEYEGEGGKYSGQPYFAVDVTPKGALREKYEQLAEKAMEGGRYFKKIRIDLEFAPSEAAILAQARSVLDWNNRNQKEADDVEQFCSACGGRTLSVQAGTKRTCPPYDLASQKNPNDIPQERAPCISRKGVHNIAFPRTDPTVIMAIVNSTGDKVLLGRQRRWPADFYSCLAGFCEPAESVEEAVRRETWEESGVRVGRVIMHSSQPWPYPACLMLGAIGEALPNGEDIVLKHDPELHDAQWFPMSTIKEAFSREQVSLSDAPPESHIEGDLRLPPATAIAHQLLIAVAGGFHLASAAKI
ncbi:NADH pyrophosphatase [Rhizina undulata]